MARGRKPKTEKVEIKQEVYTDLEPQTKVCKTREEIFAELKAKVDENISAFELAAKENRELAFRIIAAKKELERLSKRLN